MNSKCQNFRIGSLDSIFTLLPSMRLEDAPFIPIAAFAI
jgi:hypothetical protein